MPRRSEGRDAACKWIADTARETERRRARKAAQGWDEERDVAEPDKSSRSGRKRKSLPLRYRGQNGGRFDLRCHARHVCIEERLTRCARRHAGAKRRQHSYANEQPNATLTDAQQMKKDACGRKAPENIRMRAAPGTDMTASGETESENRKDMQEGREDTV